MTLTQAEMSRPARIVGFSGLNDDERLCLEALGLELDVLVTKLLKTPLRDPVECLVGSQLLMLERRILDRIMVEAA